MDRRSVLMSHFTNPVNFGLVEDQNRYQKILRSPACSDEITIQIASLDNKIVEIKFIGTACVIATSSSDILFTLLKDKTFDQARDLIDRYQAMIWNGNQPDADFGELEIFDNVHRQKGRWKCATLGSEGVLDFINKTHLN